MNGPAFVIVGKTRRCRPAVDGLIAGRWHPGSIPGTVHSDDHQHQPEEIMSMTFQEKIAMAVTCNHLPGRTADGDSTRKFSEMDETSQRDAWRIAASMFDAEKAKPEDVVYMRQRGRTHPVMLLCQLCTDALPSVRKNDATIQKIEADRAAAAAADHDEMVERFESGETLHRCNGCDQIHGEDDLVEVRHCPHCEEDFNATDAGGRNCETCNRPFTSKVCPAGCPDCLTDEDLEPVTDVAQLEVN